MIQATTARHLTARYEALLIDSYGVLVSSSGLIDGAIEFIRYLNTTSTPYLILTNDASRFPETKADWYQKIGIDVTADRIVTSGSLLSPWFKQEKLEGSRCVVLGPEDSHRYVREAGGEIVEPGDDSAEVLVACDDSGFPFLKGIEAVISQAYRAVDRGKPLKMVLPNPDLLYPKGPQNYGLTSGSIALLVEEAMRLRYPTRHDLVFTRLGKPHKPIYDAAYHRLKTRNLVMIGDQLRTDVEGATNYGIASALVNTGLIRWGKHMEASALQPTWLLPSIHPDAPLPEEPPQALRCIVSGRVQGVYYRASTRDRAQGLELRGWVKNLPDGRVELFAEGHAHSLEALVAWCARGPAMAKVEHVETKNTAPQNYTDFQILR